MAPKVKKVFITIPIIILSILILLVLGFGIYFAIVTKDAKLNKNLLPTVNAAPVFYDVNGEEIPYFSKNKVEVEEIPANLYSAFVAIEDKRFEEHNGIDYKRIGGAILSNIKAGASVEGASTITQQLVKNTHLTQEKSLNRKLKEMVIAKQLEKEYSKNEIMAMYLSVIYFGNGAYGIKDAANIYFSKSIDQLTLSECATLAGTVKNPSRYAPDKGENAVKRRNLVLKLMLEQGKISEKDYESAKDENLTSSVTKSTEENGEKFYLKNCISELTKTLNVTGYELENMGLKVFTFYDPTAQKILINSLKNTCVDSDANGMGIILDNTTNGVAAYYSTSGIAEKRQVGSTIKPLAVFTPALNENLIYTVSPIKDEKISFGNYSPKNYGDKYYGWTTIEQAVMKSMNSVAVKTLSYLTVEKSAAYLNKMNFPLTESDMNLSLALGTITDGITPKTLADGYKTLANGGRFSSSKFIREIITIDGKSIEFTNDEENVFDSESAYLMTDMLMKTVQNGTAKSLSTLQFNVAAKTGTASVNGKNTDAINAGYTSAHTVVCWQFGKDINGSGGGLPTICAKNIYEKIYEDFVPNDFAIPCGITELEIDEFSLQSENRVKLASKNTPNDYITVAKFKSNFIPNEISSTFDQPKLNSFSVEYDKQNKICKISFEATPVYGYTVYKIINGIKTEIADVYNECGTIEISDEASKGNIVYSIQPYCLLSNVIGKEINQKFIFD